MLIGISVITPKEAFWPRYEGVFSNSFYRGYQNGRLSLIEQTYASTRSWHIAKKRNIHRITGNNSADVASYLLCSNLQMVLQKLVIVWNNSLTMTLKKMELLIGKLLKTHLPPCRRMLHLSSKLQYLHKNRLHKCPFLLGM